MVKSITSPAPEDVNGNGNDDSAVWPVRHSLLKLKEDNNLNNLLCRNEEHGDFCIVCKKIHF